ncbi:unnamed protein product [Arctogadus glacialis]
MEHWQAELCDQRPPQLPLPTGCHYQLNIGLLCRKQLKPCACALWTGAGRSSDSTVPGDMLALRTLAESQHGRLSVCQQQQRQVEVSWD